MALKLNQQAKQYLEELDQKWKLGQHLGLDRVSPLIRSLLSDESSDKKKINDFNKLIQIYQQDPEINSKLSQLRDDFQRKLSLITEAKERAKARGHRSDRQFRIADKSEDLLFGNAISSVATTVKPEQHPIISFLSEKDIRNLSMVNRKSQAALREHVKIIEEWMRTSGYPLELFRYIPVEVLLKAKEIVLTENQFRGSYIDFLRPDDIPDQATLTRVRDPWNRVGIAMLYSTQEDEPMVQTFFQRYAGDLKTWTSGGLAYPIGIPGHIYLEANHSSLSTQYIKDFLKLTNLLSQNLHGRFEPFTFSCLTTSMLNPIRTVVISGGAHPPERFVEHDQNNNPQGHHPHP
jgi:hypothetical protein